MSPFSWQCQNLCLLSLAFIIDWRVVTIIPNLGEWDLHTLLHEKGAGCLFFNFILGMLCCCVLLLKHENDMRDMKEPSIVIGNSGAPSVTTNAQRQVIRRDMKEPTLVVVNHLAAPSVTTHAQHQVI